MNLIAYPKSYSLVSDGMQLPVYFISDVHLMDQLSESETNNQKPLYRFLDHIKHTGGTLFINGDLFDFYFEYKDVIPKGYFPIYNQLYTLKNSGIEIHYILGNHDYWVMDFMKKHLTTQTYENDVTLELNGKKFYISHGDGYLSWDHGYRLLKRIIHSRLFIWSYSWIHPNISFKIASWISKRGKHYDHSDEYNQRVLDEMTELAREKVRQGFDYLVLGHYHQAIDQSVESGKLIILGDWLTFFTYGYFDGTDLTLKKWSENET